MKTTGNARRHRWVAALTTTLMVITAAQALADGLSQVDGDTDSLGNQEAITVSDDACDAEAVFNGDVRLKFNGNSHYNKHSDVVLVGSPEAGSGITVTGSTVNVGDWGDDVDEVSPTFSVTVPTTTPDGEYTVSLQTSGDGYDKNDAPVSPFVVGPATLEVIVDCGREAGGNNEPVITDLDLNPVDACTVEADVEWTDDAGDTHTVTFEWGDGTDDTVVMDAESRTAEQHTYGAAGTYTVKATVTDQDSLFDDASDTFSAYNTPSAILQPINDDGSSVFKIKSTIPVKITVTGCDGEPVDDLSPALSLKKTSGVAVGTDEGVVSTSAADSGMVMRWSPDGEQYIYNLATKGKTSGTYELSISDSSFEEDVVETFGLR